MSRKTYQILKVEDEWQEKEYLPMSERARLTMVMYIGLWRLCSKANTTSSRRLPTTVAT